MVGEAGARLPAEFVKAVVVDAEMVADLVDYGAPDLLDHFGFSAADRAYRDPVNGDPVGQYGRIVRRSLCERNAVVEPEQTLRSRLVFDRDGHVAHQAAQIWRKAVEGMGDHDLEPFGLHSHHQVIVAETLGYRRWSPADRAERWFCALIEYRRSSYRAHIGSPGHATANCTPQERRLFAAGGTCGR